MTAGPDGQPTLRAMVDGAARLLAAAGVPSPMVDAMALAEHVLGVDRLVLALAPTIPDGFAAAYAEVVDQRRRRIPLQHIVGTQAFRHLVLAVEPGVFVPRPETEVVAQVAIDAAAAVVAGRPPGVGATPVTVVELCCGAGGIACSVATEVPGTTVTAIDVVPAAVALTARNAAATGASAVVAVVGDVTDPTLLSAMDGQVDVVVANPPYIPADAVPIEPEVRDHDPEIALYGGGLDGLVVPRAVVAAAARLLRPGGVLVMEHAEVQAAAVRDIVHASGAFTEIRTVDDLTGRNRAVVARRVLRQDVEDCPS